MPNVGAHASVALTPAPAPARPPAKAGETLARRIESEIMQQGWPIGKLLGTEPQLLQRYGVSRPVLREAVRILEHHMVAQMRRGSGGGLRVTAPNSSAITRAATLYLDYRVVRVSQLYSTRALLGARCIELTTERLTEEGIAQMRDIVDRLRSSDVVELVEIGTEVETTIAELSGDPVLKLFLNVLLDLVKSHYSPPETRPQRTRLIHMHRDHQIGIAEAVIAGDAAAARLRLVRHLEWSAENSRNAFLQEQRSGTGTALLTTD